MGYTKFILKNEIPINCKSEKADKYHKHHQIQKNNVYYDWLIHFYYTFFIRVFAAYSLYDNVVVVFFVEGHRKSTFPSMVNQILFYIINGFE